MRFLIIFFLLVSPCLAEVTYEVKETIEYFIDNVQTTKEGVIENIQAQTSKPIKTVFTLFSDIYINGNLIAENVETNKVVGAELTCKAFLTEWNKGRMDKVSAVDIESMREKE